MDDFDRMVVLYYAKAQGSYMFFEYISMILGHETEHSVSTGSPGCTPAVLLALHVWFIHLDLPVRLVC
jgi:hypothetical protein